MKCFYHNDLDGRCAGAIVNQFREGKKVEQCAFVEMQYDKDFPIDSIEPEERIYIVDFHVQDDDDFVRLQEITNRVTLIDHHKSTAEHLQKYPELYSGVESIIDINHSGCWLVWEYFSFVHDMKIPKAIKLIDDMDRWIWKYGDDTECFTEGMKLFPHQPEDEIWHWLLYDTTFATTFANDKVQDIIDKGEICVQYVKMLCADYTKQYGFETEFEGHKAFAQGLYKYGSKVFGKRIDEYPLCLSFEFTGNGYIIGLYSKTIDVSEIAVRYNGGGHKNAAGFVWPGLPFRKANK